MAMVVRSNIMALNANRQLGMNNSQVSKSLEKLSSGFKINRAGDDASGLAISEKMKAQIKGLETASANSQDGVSLIQTAEGALTEVHAMLNRMVELATKSANGTIKNEVDRAAIQEEVNALSKEIDRIGDSTNFNGINLLDGSLGGYTSAGTDNSGIDASSIRLNGDFGIGGSVKMGLDYAVTEMTIGGNTLELNGTTEGEISKYLHSTVARAGENGQVVSFTVDWAELKADAGAMEAVKNLVGGLDALKKVEKATVTFRTDGSPVTATDIAFAAEGPTGLQLQVGDTNDTFNKVNVQVDDLRSASLGIKGLVVSNQDDAGDSVQTIKDAINKVSTNRANLGALQNRLEYTINNLDVSAENMNAANSRIRDTDMAKQMMDYTKMNVLTQAAQAMLAQANQQPQSILQLLQ